jgi:hypothetical protein
MWAHPAMNRSTETANFARRFGPLLLVPLGTAVFAIMLCPHWTWDRDPDGAALPQDEAPEVGRIRRDFGVRVHVRYDARNYFPDHARRSPASAQGVQIEVGGTKRIMRLIPEFLGMYPRPVIAANLRNIYLLGRLSFYGLEYGGTYIQDGI